MGRVPWESVHAIRTRLINRGAESIRIATLRASCDCTGFDPSPYLGQEVPPGGALDLSFNLRTGRRLGSRQSEIEVLTETGAVYWFSVRYDGFATFTWSPPELTFGAVDLDDEAEDVVQPVVFRSAAARIESVKSDAPWLEATWDDSRPGEAIIYVHVAKRHLAHEMQFATLMVTTSDAYVTTFAIRVSARGVAALRALPGHVFVRRGRAGGVMLLRADGTMARLESVTAESHDLGITFVPGSSDVRVEPEVTCAAGVHRVHVRDATGYTTRFLVSVLP
ncbi:MAG: DUF1573 domain-containing protein [Phycisphaerae bacterium]|nr:DUF1573 domain-containing protein [Phycisphaerae bacterium]